MLPLGPEHRPGTRLAAWLGLGPAAPAELFRGYCRLRGLLTAAMVLYLAAGVCWIGRLAYRIAADGGAPPAWSWLLALGLMSVALLLSGAGWVWGRRLRRELLCSGPGERKHGLD